jgi:hypothetical protein
VTDEDSEGFDHDHENSSEKEEEEKNTAVMVDVSGHPILPKLDNLSLKSMQAVVRDIFTRAYGKFNFSIKP